MKKSVLLILSFLVAPFAKGESEFQTLHSVEELRLNSSTKLILLADQSAHGDSITLKNLESILDAIQTRDKGFNCYFPELSPELDSAIDEYIKYNKSYDDSVLRRVDELTKNYSFLKFKNILPSDLLDKIRQLGISVFGADFQFDSPFGKDFLTWLDRLRTKKGEVSIQEEVENEIKLTVQGRNKIMAENITAYLTSGKCKKGIFFVGSGHLRNYYRGRSIKSLQSYFNSFEIPYEIYGVPGWGN